MVVLLKTSEDANAAAQLVSKVPEQQPMVPFGAAGRSYPAAGGRLGGGGGWATTTALTAEVARAEARRWRASARAVRYGFSMNLTGELAMPQCPKNTG